MVKAAFKEWSAVVEALGHGEQILIFRKGGLDEGPGGFEIRHSRFWLFPTQFHQQAVRIVPSWMERLQRRDQPASEPGLIPIEFACAVVGHHQLEHPDQIQALQGLYLIRMFQLMVADHCTGKLNGDETGLGSGLVPPLEPLHPGWDDAHGLLVKLSREEPEARVANFEATRPFIETSLAKNQDLLPMPKCLHHCRPLLECCFDHLSKLNHPPGMCNGARALRTFLLYASPQARIESIMMFPPSHAITPCHEIVSCRLGHASRDDGPSSGSATPQCHFFSGR